VRVSVDMRQERVGELRRSSKHIEREPFRRSHTSMVVNTLSHTKKYGRVAQLVERSLSMGEVLSSNLISSIFF
jgi:hypothetical protein